MSEQNFGAEDLEEILSGCVDLPEGDAESWLELSFDELGFDSLVIVELQLAVEQRFGVVISDDVAEGITNLRGAIDCVNRELSVQMALE